MLSDKEIEDADFRLEDGKLTLSDVDDLVGVFRLVLGPLETRDNMNLQSTLEALDDSVDGSRLKAAKMAACLVRLKNEDFGVATITDEITNSDEEQRRLFTIYALSLLYKIPPELVYLDFNNRILSASSRKVSSTIRVTTVP